MKPAAPPAGTGRGAAHHAAAAGGLAVMRVLVLLPHHDVEEIGCPRCSRPPFRTRRRRRREWTCPSCRAAGTIRVAGHPTRRHIGPTRTPLPSA